MIVCSNRRFQRDDQRAGKDQAAANPLMPREFLTQDRGGQQDRENHAELVHRRNL